MRQASRCLHRGVPVVSSPAIRRPLNRSFQRPAPCPSRRQQLLFGAPARSFGFFWKDTNARKPVRLQAKEDSDGSDAPERQGSAEDDEQDPDKSTAVEAFYSPWVARIRNLLVRCLLCTLIGTPPSFWQCSSSARPTCVRFLLHAVTSSLVSICIVEYVFNQSASLTMLSMQLHVELYPH